MGRLDGKVAIVTGASRGTGAAIAARFVAEGARVLMGDVRDDEGMLAARALGDGAQYAHLDVTDERSWTAAVAAATDHLGAPNVLVNNAGILHMASIEDTTPEDFERVLRVNQLGTFLGVRAVVEAMRAQGGGAIVNIASVDAVQGKNGVVAYASSKWGVRGITKVAALELGRWGIRVNTICPEAGSAAMMSPYIPEGIDPELAASLYQRRLATQKTRGIAERLGDIAALAVFLASDEAASCTGADFIIDSGNTAGTIVKGAPGA